MIEPLEKLGERALGFPEEASSIIIHDAKTLRGANNFLLTVKGMLKEVKEAFGPIIEKAHKTHKEALAQKKKYDEPLLQAERSVKMQIGVYVRKLEDDRLEAARKVAAAEAERMRKEAEIEAEAQRFENHGHRKEAAEIRDTKPLPVIENLPDAPSLNGISISKNLTFEITNEAQVPRRFLSIDMVKIRAYIREHKEAAIAHDIPGIRVYYEDSVRARSQV